MNISAEINPVLPSKPTVVRDWQSRWSAFKSTLPHQQQPYAKREWGGSAHSMCSYQGKMKPALAHHLLDCFSVPGDVVVDPFSGAGTIPFEACRMQRFGYGLDISNLGYVLTLGKVGSMSPARVTELLTELEDQISTYIATNTDWLSASAINFNGSIPDFFHENTLREVIAARHFFFGSMGQLG